MAEGGERKKARLNLDYNQLIRGDEPLPELIIQDAAEEKWTPTEEVDVGNDIQNLSEKDLMDTIPRMRKLLQNASLPDGGDKLRVRLKGVEAELARRKLHKDDKTCKKVTTLDDEDTCNGPTNDLSQPRAPPSEHCSRFGFEFCNILDNKGTNKSSFTEELYTLNQCDHMKRRDHNPFSAPITQKKGLSSRQTSFKSPSHLSVNIDNQQQTNREQRGSHDFNPSSHLSDRDASCCLTRKEIGAHSHSLRPLNSRRNNRKTVVLVDEEELEVDVVDETDLVGQSSIDARIYYPSRDDRDFIEICNSDMGCLKPESYLSSPIMNFYIRYLQKPTSPSARTERDFHIFNTYFYEKLKQDVLTKTETEREALFVKFRRWWKGVNIFEKAYIFLPIHENQHWSLAIICMPNKEDEFGPIILHLDSVGLHISKSIFSNVKSFLIEEWKFLREEDALHELPFAENIWKRLSRKINEKVIEADCHNNFLIHLLNLWLPSSSMPTVPQQENGYDCGLFVLFFIERFIDDAPERLKNRDLEMFGRQWFRPEEASSLRRKLRNLLIKEFKNANKDACKLGS